MNEQIRKFINTAGKYMVLIDFIEHRKRNFGGTELYPSEIHSLVYMADHTEKNFSEIAGGLGMTKGAFTKIAGKLLAKKLLKKFNRPENKKSVFFALTQRGQAAVDAHTEFHKEVPFSLQREFSVFLKENREILDTYHAYTDQFLDDLLEALQKEEG